MRGQLSWVEIDGEALAHNLRTFARLAGPGVRLAAVVKANAYGHGLLETAALAVEAGAEWLAVHSLDEGLALRRAGHGGPVLCLGYVPLAAVPEALEACLRLTVYNEATLRELSKAACRLDRKARVHLKLETGTHRQGITGDELGRFRAMAAELPGLELEGASTHFANIEDTTDHRFALEQLRRFGELSTRLEALAGRPLLKHCACTAAALLLPETHFDLIRLGIGLYGLWPSRETLVSVLCGPGEVPQLRPVMSWKALLAQIKEVPAGEPIGYGCTYRTTRRTRVGVVPVGYSDGYDRGLSGRSHVLIRGRRASVLGRICMNLFMVDLTDMGPVELEDEVVLLGGQGEERISAETLAGLLDTISYEVVARVSPALPRVVVRHGATASEGSSR